jgi:hypothetical protein
MNNPSTNEMTIFNSEFLNSKSLILIDSFYETSNKIFSTKFFDVLKDVKRNGASSATHGNKSARLVNTNSKYDSGFSEPLQNALANVENSEVRRELPPLKGEMRQLSLQSSPNNLPDIDSIA